MTDIELVCGESYGKQTNCMNTVCDAGNMNRFLTVCVYVLQNAEAVRCYCNEAACVSNSYVCKSQIGFCFSQSTPDVAVAVSHGCAESLPEQLLVACTERRQQNITCCTEDLCNYNIASRTGIWAKCMMCSIRRLTIISFRCIVKTYNNSNTCRNSVQD